MKRFAWLFVVLACVAFVGCGGDGAASAPDDADANSADVGDMTDELEEAGMDPNMSAADYAAGGKKAGQ